MPQMGPMVWFVFPFIMFSFLVMVLVFLIEEHKFESWECNIKEGGWKFKW